MMGAQKKCRDADETKIDAEISKNMNKHVFVSGILWYPHDER